MFKMTIAGYDFTLRFEDSAAPQTVEFIKGLLPLEDKVIHVRWSGGAIWIPFGEKYSKLDLEYENATCHPSAGELLLYIGGPSEPELLIPYGNARFSSTVGDLPGNHFATIIDGYENLSALGEKVLWQGAQDITISAIE